MSQKIFSHIHPDYRQIAEFLSPEIPAFFEPFFDSPALLRLKGIGQNCGTEFGNFHHYLANFSRLDHSLWVGIIAWNFSKDPKVALAGLFHDMAHTVFSHVGDFLFWDPENQETAENGLSDMLRGDPVIPRELAKLGLTIEDVEDYARYPIADNPGPKLSSDRLEYTLALGYMLRIKTINELPSLYNDIIIVDGEDERLAFRTPEKALEFAQLALQNDASCCSSYEESAMMHFFAGILACLIADGKLTQEELYTLSDADVIGRIEHSQDAKTCELWDYYRSFNSYQILRYPKKTGKFTVSSKIKRRFIDPLVVSPTGKTKRVSELFPDFHAAIEYHKNKNQWEEWVVVDYPEFRPQYL